MSKKNALGQFYTTQYEYVLQNLTIPQTVRHIIEPFAGKGDLLKFLDKDRVYDAIECYDIDPKNKTIIQRDTLEDPPCYDGKFVLTNPPYLARNKNDNKKLYDKYKCNDLYKCFITNLVSSNCSGGILIIPLNFISSIRKSDVDLRRRFFKKFDISTINIFEERVFDDTAYTVCSFVFEKKQAATAAATTQVRLYPLGAVMRILFSEDNNYTIGGEIYKLEKSQTHKIERATRLTPSTGITNILLKCIDDSHTHRLGLRIVSDAERYIDTTENLSARSYATLVIDPPIDAEKQKKIVNRFNEYIRDKRDEYNSLFLTNYREGSRKRISFDLAFKICGACLISN